MRRFGALLVLVAVLATGCLARRTQYGEGGTALSGTWRRLPQAPLSARYEAHSFAVGDEVFVLGGTNAPPCPPTADCVASKIPPLRDGAVYSTAADAWRSVAQAPAPLGHGSGAVAGHRIYLWIPAFEGAEGVRAAFLRYDTQKDRWEELPAPSGPERRSLLLVAAGDRIVAYHSTQEVSVQDDLVFDEASRSWKPLPRDPLVPSFDRTMVWTGSELALIGPEDVPQPGSAKPAIYRAAALDLTAGTWQRLPDSEIAGSDPGWFFAGKIVVNAAVGSVDGGEVNNYGRSYPIGGMLDPASGAWRTLPNAPPPGTWRGPSAANAEFVVTTGRVLHVANSSWASLSMPSKIDSGHAVTWTPTELFVWGGYAWNESQSQLLSAGWMWRPLVSHVIP